MLRGLRVLQQFHQVGDGQAGVDDVLDQDDVAVGDVALEILLDLHHAGALGAAVVAGDGHEIDLVIDRHAAGQVGQERIGALEDAHEDRRAVLGSRG